MSQRDFNKNLDDYLTKRTKGISLSASSLKGMFKKKPSESEKAEKLDFKEGKVHVIEGDKSIIDNIREFFSSFTEKPQEDVPPEVVEQDMEKAASEVPEAPPAGDSEFEKEEEELQKESEISFSERISLFFASLKKPFTRDEVDDDYEDVHNPEEEHLEKELEEIESEEDVLKRKEEELDLKRRNILNKVLDRLRISAPSSDVAQDHMIGLESDLKDISKIAADVMKRLPPEQLAEFKSSQEFKDFRAILYKHNLIKNKDYQAQ